MGALAAARHEYRPRRLQLALLGVAVLLGLMAGSHPKIAVAAAVGLAFVAVVISDLTLGLCLFAIVVFMDLVPDIGVVVSFTKVAGLLLAVSWVAASSTSDRFGRSFVAAHPFVLYVLVLFLGWVALSLTWAEDVSVTTTPLLRYLLNAVLFVIVFAAVRERRHVPWLLAAYLTGAALSAMYGFVVPPATSDVGQRVTGSIGDPNELAAVLLPAFVVGLALAASLKRAPIARMAALFGAVVSLAGLFLTLSRGGLIALGAALLAAIVFGGRWRVVATIVALVIGLAGLGYFAFFASTTAKQRVTNLGNGTGRTDIWTVGLREFKANPVTGVGVGNFRTSSVHYLLAPGQIKRADFIVDKPKVAHNTYLHVLAELGIVGLVLFLSIILFAVSCAYRAAREFARKRDVRMELLARATLVGVIGLLSADFFISEMYSKQLWLLLGFCPALLAVARRQPPATEEPGYVRPGIAAHWSAAPSPTARELPPVPVTV